MQAKDQFIVAHGFLIEIKQRLRRRFEAYAYFRHLGGQALAGAQQKRHAPPAPVIHIKSHGGKCFGDGIVRHAFLVPVSGHGFAPDASRPVLGSNRAMAHIFRIHAAHGAHHLHLLIPHGIGIQGNRRLHRHQGHHLNQMALNHVSQRAGLFIITRAIFNTQRFGHGDLDVINVISIPQWLQHRIGKTEHHQILYGLFPQIMVNAINL